MSCNDNSYIDEDEAYAQGTYHDCDEGIEEEPDVYDVDLDLPPSPTRLRTTSMGSTLDHPDVITHYIGGRRDSDYSSSQSPADVDPRMRDPHYLSSLSPHSSRSGALEGLRMNTPICNGKRRPIATVLRRLMIFRPSNTANPPDNASHRDDMEY